MAVCECDIRGATCISDAAISSRYHRTRRNRIAGGHLISITSLVVPVLISEDHLEHPSRQGEIHPRRSHLIRATTYQCATLLEPPPMHQAPLRGLLHHSRNIPIATPLPVTRHFQDMADIAHPTTRICNSCTLHSSSQNGGWPSSPFNHFTFCSGLHKIWLEMMMILIEPAENVFKA